MNNMKNSASPKSALNLAKEAKELLKPKEVKQPDRSPAGLDNPAVFGKHNINFNKNCL